MPIGHSKKFFYAQDYEHESPIDLDVSTIDKEANPLGRVLNTVVDPPALGNACASNSGPKAPEG